VILWKTSHSASEGDIAVTAPSSIDPARFLHDQLASASPGLLRSMLTTFVNTLMSAEADAICGAPYGMPGPDRVNVRNGYRHRDFDTRAGTLDVAIPKLRSGSYFPDWLLERRRRAEAALTTVVATCYLLGVSTRRMEKLAGVAGHHEAEQIAGLGDGRGSPARPWRTSGPGRSTPARTPSSRRTRWC
jgi:Transposase, Mutator family